MEIMKRESNTAQVSVVAEEEKEEGKEKKREIMKRGSNRGQVSVVAEEE